MRLTLPLVYFLFFIACLPCNSYSSKIVVSGNVSGAWNTDSVIVQGNIDLIYPNTLSIRKGCKVLFDGYYQFKITGQLIAIGDILNPIQFKALDTTGFSTGSVLGWKGITINSWKSSPSIFEFCSFQFIKNQSNCIEVEYGFSSFKNCTFFDNQASYVISIYNKNCKVENSIFAYNKGNAVLLQGKYQDTIAFKQNTITNNTGIGLRIEGNVFDAYFNITNNIIWNNQADEVFYTEWNNGFQRSYVILRNCIIKDGYFHPLFNNSCFATDPKFINASLRNFGLQWDNYPIYDTSRSVAIDNGYQLEALDDDSSRSDIGATSFYNEERRNLTTVRFAIDTTLGYLSNLTVNFNNLSHVGNIFSSWEWDFGDGNMSNLKQPSHTYTSTGTFHVKLKANDANGHTDSLIWKNAITVLPGSRVNGGAVSGIWTKNKSPYYIYGNIYVPEDQMLEIEPGIKVEFQGTYRLDVQGGLKARGTSQDSIYFDTFDTTGLYLNNDTILSLEVPHRYFTNGWNGIHFTKKITQQDSCIVEYCNISNVRRGNNGNRLYGVLTFKATKNAVVRHSTFHNNIMPKSTGTPVYDTLPYFFNSGVTAFLCNPIIESNRFNNLYNALSSCIFVASADSVRINNNFFSECRDNLIYLWNVKEFRISNNEFQDNKASNMIYLLNDDSLRIKNNFSSINNNLFQNNGSAIVGNRQDKIRIVNNKFINGNGGAAIYIWGDSLYVLNNLFAGNKTSGGDNRGACLSIFVDMTRNAVVANNTMVNNQATTYYQAAGIYGDDAVKVYNNIIRNLSTPELMARKFTTSYEFSTFKESYNNNIKGGYPYGFNNIDVNPDFVNEHLLDFSLNNSSPCIDKGYTITDSSLLPPFDLAGNLRIDTMLGKIDIGAYEYAMTNHAPNNLSLSNDTIKEHLPIRSFIGKFATSDTDMLDLHSYSFSNNSSTNDNTKFIIVQDSLLSGEQFDYQTLNMLPIKVRTTDKKGAFLEKDFVIMVKQNAVTGIIEVNRLPNGVVVSPNPFNEYFLLQNNNNEKLILTLYSTNGSLVFKNEYRKGNYQIDCAGLTKGAYCMIIQVRGSYYSIKLVKS